MDKQELTDIFRDAIDSAHDYDSTASHFAKACADALDKAGLTVVTKASEGMLPDREAFWLVERKVQPPQYVGTGAGFTADAWRATRWDTERQAHDFWRTMNANRDECHPVEHLFINKR